VETALEELCILVASITQASKVCVSAFDRKNDVVNFIARSTGGPETLNGRFALDGLTQANSRFLVPDIDASNYYANHPIKEVYPFTRSFAGFWIMEQNEVRHMLGIWNPCQDFFSNHRLANAIDHCVGIASKLLTLPAVSASVVDPPNSFAETVALPKLGSDNFNREPASRFLIDTLISKQRLLERKGCSYLALRQWRKPIKPYQISALTALKASSEPRFESEIGNEISSAITSVFGKAFQYVVPIPSGSSGQKHGLSYRLAKEVADKLKITLADVLEAPPVALGSSHPRKSASLRPYKVKTPINGNILIIDDVATSGRHIELATEALRPMATYCTSLVWISD
jgi:hypothetical protein